MKKEKHYIALLLVVAMICSSIFMASCSKDDEDEVEAEGVLVLTLDLESDSDNGVEWEFTQNDNLFSSESIFLENEGAGEGGELQSFILRPIASGTTTIIFANESTDTTYTYECTVSEDLESVEVGSAKGESGGAEVETPVILQERN